MSFNPPAVSSSTTMIAGSFGNVLHGRYVKRCSVASHRPPINESVLSKYPARIMIDFFLACSAQYAAVGIIDGSVGK